MNNTSSPAVPCLLETWHLVESELFLWLLKQSQNETLAFDLLQETFLRALQLHNGFCDISNQRAWLYQVSRNLLNDEWRRSAKQITLSDSFGDSLEEKTTDAIAPVDSLAQCLPKALGRLTTEDRVIIESCDIIGMSQQEFAHSYGLTLSASKSRLKRARIKLKQTLKAHCQIRFDEQQRVCCFFPPE